MTDYNIEFKDHKVVNPHRFRQVQVSPGIVDLIPIWIEDPSQIIEEGTAVNADLFDKLRANVTRRSETFTATAGQTVFNLTKSYLVNQGRVDVYVSGVKQRSGIDFMETNPTRITMTQGQVAGTVIEVVYFSASQALSEDLIEQVQAAEAATSAAVTATTAANTAAALARDSSLKWKSPVATLAALNALANPQTGDARQVTAEQKGYRYDGATWQIISEMNLTPLTEVDNRLTSQLADIEQAIGVNLADFPRLQGENDDTNRFKRAVASMQKVVESTPAQLTLATEMQLTIPSGVFTISDEINFSEYATIISEGKSIIKQTNSEKRIFVFRPVFGIDIQGIQFVGGSNAIYASNANIDTTMINIERCEFHWQSDYSIYTWGTWHTSNHMSANLTIRKCKFVKPNGVLYNVCDHAIVADCWVYPSRDNFQADRAVFVNRHGTLIFDSMFGVPTMGAGSNILPKTRWVDNHRNFRATHSRFGGEDDGIPIVYNYGGTGVNNMGAFIIIENSQVSCGLRWQRDDAGIIVLKTKVPQLIRLEGNDYLLLAPYINVDPTFNLTDHFNGITNADTKFNFKIDTNMIWGIDLDSPAYPQALERYMNKSTKDALLHTSTAQLTTSTRHFVFSLPKNNTFTYLVTFSSNHNPAGAGTYRNSFTFLLTMVTAFDGNAVVNKIITKMLFEPSVGVDGYNTLPTLNSVHFGSSSTGSDTRNLTSGGNLSMVFGNSRENSTITVKRLHLG